MRRFSIFANYQGNRVSVFEEIEKVIQSKQEDKLIIWNEEKEMDLQVEKQLLSNLEVYKHG